MTSVLYCLAPFGAAVIAALLATVYRPGVRLRSMTQHLAAGVILAAVSLELVPDVMHRHAPVPTLVGFVVAVVSLLLLKKAESRSGKRNGKSRFPIGYIVATGIDLFVDGFVVAIGFRVGQKQGKILALALALELLSLGLASVSELQMRSVSRWKAMGVTAGVSGLLLAGSIFGVLILPKFPAPLLTAALAFGVAAILFLVTEELLREAHETEDTLLATAVLFLGFLAILLLDLTTS